MKSLIDEYAEGYQNIVIAIQGVSEDELYFKPTNKSWSIKEIIIHLADAEMVGIHRMKRVLSEDNPLLTIYEQELWASQLNYVVLDHQHYLHLFKCLRESLLPNLVMLNEHDWSRVGTHEEEGPMTLKALLERYVNHAIIHVSQIQRNLKTYRTLSEQR